jgi:hypothetical protein
MAVDRSADPAGVLVDVGIPALPESRYLHEAVESVLAQTLPAWSLHVSINGAEGGMALERLSPYLGDPRITYSVTGELIPAGQNFTGLIRTGKAPIVGLLHDDDRWHPDFLRRCATYLDEHRDCGLAFMKPRVIDENGDVVGQVRVRLQPGVYSSERMLDRLLRDNVVSVATVLVRRSAYEAVGNAYSDLLFNDYEMWFRIAALYETAYLEGVGGDYRHHPNQLSSQLRFSLTRARLEALDTVNADVPLPQATLRRARADAYLGCALDTIELGERRPALELLAKATGADARWLLRPVSLARGVAVVASVLLGSRVRRRIMARRRRRWITGRV